MIAYFDTSAVIPLLVEEPASTRARLLWDAADRVLSVDLVYAEGRAALALAHRMDRLTVDERKAAVAGLDRVYGHLDRVRIDEWLVRRAGLLAERHALRGYDAVHLAAAEHIDDPETILVAGDAALVAAAQDRGLAVSRLAPR